MALQVRRAASMGRREGMIERETKEGVSWCIVISIDLAGDYTGGCNLCDNSLGYTFMTVALFLVYYILLKYFKYKILVYAHQLCVCVYVSIFDDAMCIPYLLMSSKLPQSLAASFGGSGVSSILAGSSMMLHVGCWLGLKVYKGLRGLAGPPQRRGTNTASCLEVSASSQVDFCVGLLEFHITVAGFLWSERSQRVQSNVF